jgi:hypothetical protein
LDLNVFKGQFGLTMTPGISADGAADGLVDGADFLLWQQRVGATSGSATATAVQASFGSLSAELTAAAADEVFAAGDFTGLFAAPEAYRPPRRGQF